MQTEKACLKKLGLEGDFSPACEILLLSSYVLHLSVSWRRAVPHETWVPISHYFCKRELRQGE